MRIGQQNIVMPSQAIDFARPKWRVEMGLNSRTRLSRGKADKEPLKDIIATICLLFLLG